jgi:hypothetical protein
LQPKLALKPNLKTKPKPKLNPKLKPKLKLQGLFPEAGVPPMNDVWRATRNSSSNGLQ